MHNIASSFMGGYLRLGSAIRCKRRVSPMAKPVRSIVAALALISFLLSPTSAVQAQGCERICDQYMNFARGAGAMSTYSRLVQLYQACESCRANRGAVRSNPNQRSSCGGGGARNGRGECIPYGAVECPFRGFCPSGTMCTATGCSLQDAGTMINDIKEELERENQVARENEERLQQNLEDQKAIAEFNRNEIEDNRQARTSDLIDRNQTARSEHMDQSVEEIFRDIENHHILDRLNAGPINQFGSQGDISPLTGSAIFSRSGAGVGDSTGTTTYFPENHAAQPANGNRDQAPAVSMAIPTVDRNARPPTVPGETSWVQDWLNEKFDANKLSPNQKEAYEARQREEQQGALREERANELRDERAYYETFKWGGGSNRRIRAAQLAREQEQRDRDRREREISNSGDQVDDSNEATDIGCRIKGIPLPSAFCNVGTLPDWATQSADRQRTYD